MGLGHWDTGFRFESIFLDSQLIYGPYDAYMRYSTLHYWSVQSIQAGAVTMSTLHCTVHVGTVTASIMDRTAHI